MHKLVRSFLLIILLNTGAIIPAYAQWVSCNGQTVLAGLVGGESNNIKVFYSQWRYLIFLESAIGVTKACIDIGPDWKMDGFKEYPARKASNELKKVFQIRGGGLYRYFDMDGKEVFLNGDKETGVYLSETKEEKSGQTIEVVQSFGGIVSNIKDRQFFRIMNQQEWTALWERHAQPGVLVPSVNFTSNMVLVIFPGPRINSGEIKIDSIREDKGILTIDYFQVILRAIGGSETLNPYGFFVIPRSNDKIIVRENLQPLMNSVPDWSVVHEFESIR